MQGPLKLTEAGVPCGATYTVADIFADPFFTEREMLVTRDGPDLGELVLPGIVPKLSRTPGDVDWTGRREPGANNHEVYNDLLGLTTEDVEHLKARGVL